MTTSRVLLPALLVAALFPAAAGAQGALSAQGFGYPPGGLSARALGLAGATAEFDVLSPLNPAAANDIGTGIVSVQGQPEVRTVRVGEVSERSRLQRVPLVAAGLRVKGVALLVSGTTLLDRSFATRASGTAIIDGAPVPTVDDVSARGAMTELRMTAGWRWRGVRLGAAVVAVTGDNTVARERSFPDSLRFGSVLDTASIGFQGVGAALGLHWRPVSGLLLGASWRAGGRLEAVRQDTTVARASVPGRLGAGVLFDGISGTTLSASVERVGWTAMNGLGSEAATAQDVTNWAAGAEVVGGTLRSYPILWRVGYASRTLPFQLAGESVTERGVHGGIGVPLAGEGAVIDLAVQRGQRRLASDRAREDAWALTVGLTLRP